MIQFNFRQEPAFDACQRYISENYSVFVIYWLTMPSATTTPKCYVSLLEESSLAWEGPGAVIWWIVPSSWVFGCLSGHWYKKNTRERERGTCVMVFNAEKKRSCIHYVIS